MSGFGLAQGRSKTSTRLWLVALTTFAAATASGSRAVAQDREADAERLFREGQRLMEERRFGEACPKFESAYKKDGQLGTLINLAFCHKEQGATWYAWLEFREAEVKATELGRNDRKEFARARLTELEKQLPKVIVDNPKKLPLSQVLVEDRKVPEAERGAVFAVEEGRRKITFRAKGKKPVTTLITVPMSTRALHVPTPEMEDLPPEEVAPPVATPPEAASPKPGADTGAKNAESPGSTQRTVGWVAIGVGGAGIVVMSIAGVLVLTSPCASLGRDEGACTADKKDSGDTLATAATIAGVVGGIGLAGGLVLLLTAPSASSKATSGGNSVMTKKLAYRDGAVTITPNVGPTWAGLSGTF